MNLRSFARGGLLGLATLVVEKGTALVLVVALARVLSPLDYGRYSFLVAYLSLFQVLADLGTETILLRRLAAQPGDRSRLVSGALGLRLALAIAAATGAVLLAPWLGDATEPELRRRVLLAAAALLLVGQPGYRALFRAELRMGAVLGVAAVTTVLTLLLTAAALVAHAGIAGVFAALLAANVTGLACAAWLGRDLFRPHLRIDVTLWRELLREAWPIGANTLVFALGLRIAPLVLMRAHGPVEVGFFSSASRLTDALNMLADAAMLTIYPLFVRFATARPDALRALAELTAKGLGVTLLCVVLIVGPTAEQIMGTLFRPEFAVAGTALAVLSWSALLAALGAVYGHLLVSVGRQAILFRVNAVGAALQLVLQLALVPWFGVSGAALGVVLTSVASHATLYLLPDTRTWIRPCVHAVLRPAALAALLLWLSGLLPVGAPARAALLVVTFLLVLPLAGFAGPGDVRRLRALLHENDGAARDGELPVAGAPPIEP
jgi:O-antigen/teichoic acid export membrane protein